jgi:hypothetical protein
LADVKSRFKGFHVEIAARTDDDLVNFKNTVIKKVTDSGGAKYSINEKVVSKGNESSSAAAAPVEPVGSVYKKPDVVKSSLGVGAAKQAFSASGNKPPVSANKYTGTVSSKPAVAPPLVAAKKNTPDVMVGTAVSSAERIRQERERHEKELIEREKQRQAAAAADEPTPMNSAERIRQERERYEKELMERERLKQKEAEEADKKASTSSNDSTAARVPSNVAEASKSIRNVWAQREKQAASESPQIPRKGVTSNVLRNSASSLTQSNSVRNSQEGLSLKQESDKLKQKQEVEERARLARERADKDREDMERQRKEEDARRQREEEERDATRLKKQQEEDRIRAERERRDQAEAEEQQRRMEQLKLEEESKRDAVPEPEVQVISAVAVVLYDYDAAEENEMSLSEGERILDILQLDEGWWQGTVYDAAGQPMKSGLFPANYVEVVAADQLPAPETVQQQQPPVVEEVPVPEASTQQEQPVSTISVRALYDYASTEENEVSFNEGDVLTGVQSIADDWWFGTTADGRSGLFPANYVEMIQ